MPERLPTYSPEQPTPQQLNAELISVLDLLPKESIEDEAAALEATGWTFPDDPEEDEDASYASLEATALELLGDYDPHEYDEYIDDSKLPYERLVRRRRLYSDYSEMVIGRVKGLLEKAPITKHFKNYILKEFTHWQEEGVEPDRDQQDIDNAFFFLDRPDPRSGGIFDPKRAVGFEREALRRSKWHLQSVVSGGLALESSGVGSRIGMSARQWFANLQPLREELAEWEVQIS